MRKSVKGFIVFGLGCLLMINTRGFGQSKALNDSSSSLSGTATSVSAGAKAAPSPQSRARFGVAAKFSLLGGGLEAAGRVSERTNVRAGFNMFSYSGLTFDHDSVSYKGTLSFKTVEAHYDFFPWHGGFHVSPGLLVFLGDPLKATASVAGGNYFTLGGQPYISSTTDPVKGRAKIDFNRAAPEITVGWGNLVSRKENKRVTVPFEVGIAFQGAPQSNLNLSGSVCDQSPVTGLAVNCRAIASDSSVKAKIGAEQTSLNSQMSAFKVYPILSVGIGFKF